MEEASSPAPLAHLRLELAPRLGADVSMRQGPLCTDVHAPEGLHLTPSPADWLQAAHPDANYRFRFKKKKTRLKIYIVFLSLTK